MPSIKPLATLLVATCLAVPLAHAATTRSADGRFTYATPHHRGAGFALPAGAGTTLYSNFANAYPDGLYFSGLGNTISGPAVPLSQSIASAVQFTLGHGGTATALYAAVGLITGTPYVDLAIYTDAGGVPGTMLWSSPAAVAPIFGTCCQLVAAKIGTGLALAANTPYWVVASGSAPLFSNFSGAWAVSTINQVTTSLSATNFGGKGWQSFPANTPPAFAIMGN